MSASSKPNYVYKIIPSTVSVPRNVNELPKSLPISDIDQLSKFIHLSTSTQVLNTLKWFFKEDEFVYILRLDYDKHDSQIHWEDPKAEVCGPRGGEGMFPHLYNELKLGKDEIDQVEILKNGDGGWNAAVELASQDWLVW